jgi:hypothetical protein
MVVSAVGTLAFTFALGIMCGVMISVFVSIVVFDVNIWGKSL